ncbi:MAG: tRNA pseudouridine(55) synthase TruB [Alphaproteobacteria bacterium]|nr:tRNA pseudouridine(55) synthase TruB [Alphaproteobacteria bacterium]
MGKRRNKKGDPISGWVNLDKPYGMTSTQAIGKIRRLLNAQKIGHAGTLDPLATGILPIALGEATKTISFVQDDLKTYQFTVAWGEQRSTDDLEGEIIASSEHRPSKEDILTLLPRFTGKVEQIPPSFSAIKIDGKRAYDLARSGKEIELKSRIVNIEKLELIEARENEADFEMLCGKGTYVRSLARDMGESLNCYGYVSKLCRTQVGCFSQENAILLDILEKMDYVSARSEALLPVKTVLDDIPALAVNEEETAKIRSGQSLEFISRPNFERLTALGLGTKETQLAVVLFQGELVAIIEQCRVQIKPIRVFNNISN